MSSASVPKLEYLRSLIRSVEKPLDRERLPFSLLPSGVPKGALVEISGPGKTETVVQFLAENKDLRIAWIEDQMTVYPTAIGQRNVSLSRILFVEAADQIVWAAMQIMRSQLFDCVVMSLSRAFDDKVLRRLQLDCEKSQVCIFLLTAKPHKAWPISIQVQVKRPAKVEASLCLDINVSKERA